MGHIMNTSYLSTLSSKTWRFSPIYYREYIKNLSTDFSFLSSYPFDILYVMKRLVLVSLRGQVLYFELDRFIL